MTPEEFRRHGRALVDWIADYLETIEQRPVAPATVPGEVRASLPAHPPPVPEPFDDVRADLDRLIVPHLTHWQHPDFFAYFPSNSSYEAILGELVSAGLGVNAMAWATSPAATELEQLVLDWMVELLDLPARLRNDGPGGGAIQGTASEATLCAVLAARERATAGEGNRRGATAGLVAYTTAEANSSVEKGVRIAGIGSDHLRRVEIDEHFAMRPAALEAAIVRDRRAGHVPFLVVATAGTTSSLAFDPIADIAGICAANGLWLHVDGAMAGIAALVPGLRFVNAGLDAADSYCTNPHKWMGVNFDCDLFWVADRRSLIGALSILPEYLRTTTTDTGAAVDLRDWGVPLGRRFRALKLWFTIRSLGVTAVQGMIERHLELAAELVTWVRDDERFALAAPPSLNLVCLRHADGDDATERLIGDANASRRALFTRTVLGGRTALRFCIGGARTERRHVEAGWKLLQSLA